LLRQAFEIGRTMDRLLAEGIGPEKLMSSEIVGLVLDQAKHWEDSTRAFLAVQSLWRQELEARGEVDAAARRNLLFDHAARRWRENPPPNPVVAAGVTSASPALARLLRVVCELPRSAVIFPDLDIGLDDAVWAGLGVAGAPDEAGDPPFGIGDAVTHPQYHLKLLLNRMGVARGEVQPWHRAGIAAAPTERSRAISSLFLPPAASASWASLPAERRRLSGVRLMETAHPGEEAQAIAILIRRALAEPERRIALITPDRSLASRVVAHLRRWGIEADDTAGRPLPQTAAGRVLLLLAEVLAQDAAPVPLLALLEHPLVRAGEARAAWLEHARALDLALRGPRPAPGLAPLRAVVARDGSAGLTLWWAELEAVLLPLLTLADELPLASVFDRLCAAAEVLCGTALWGGADGRALAAFIDELREAAREVGTIVAARDLPVVLRDAMDRVAVRPPWGGHPRVALYGLLEARMSRADLVICGGLTEGSWPARPVPDALLPPAVLRALGVPGAEFRIGLAAHDLASALGAPQVVLSYARRDEGGPVIASRFVLRVRALLGELADSHEELEAVRLARDIDDAPLAPAYQVPRPMPSREQRLVGVSATSLDSLLGQPYVFYAKSILNLRSLDLLDANPTAAWRGIAAHDILHRWFKEAGAQKGQLLPIATDVLNRLSAHPLMRALWRPRLLAALEWIEARAADDAADGQRTIADCEVDGSILVKGIRVHARADRIDRLAGNQLAIVDYKSGKPPSGKQVERGYALQLGIIGLIAQEGGFPGISGEPSLFEYWSLGSSKESSTGFGYWQTPIRVGKKTTGLLPEEFLDLSKAKLVEALDGWILGDKPFTAEVSPDFKGYNDFDQLMRLDEWQARAIRDEELA
jgi:ATP-dependent helicase/nuclease subunit B